MSGLIESATAILSARHSGVSRRFRPTYPMFLRRGTCVGQLCRSGANGGKDMAGALLMRVRADLAQGKMSNTGNPSTSQSAAMASFNSAMAMTLSTRARASSGLRPTARW